MVLLQTLPKPIWDNKYNMYHIQNTFQNVGLVFDVFRNVAWVNTAYFLDKSKGGKQPMPTNVNGFRLRAKKDGVRYCPEKMYQKLEDRRYSFSTAKTYISMFEKFMNSHPNKPLIEIDELAISAYLNMLNQQGKSDSYLIFYDKLN